MFTRDSTELTYAAWNSGEVQLPVGSMQNACPTKADISKTSGASLVMSYLEALHNRTCGFAQCTPESLSKLYDKAVRIDKEEIGIKLESSHPTLQALMKAASSLGYVKRCKTVWFNDMLTLKHYLREYGFAIIELKLTTSTRNAYDFEILDEGDLITEKLSKGFIICKLDDENAIVQNSLGLASGVLGFNKIKTIALEKLLIKGACFVVEEDQTND